MLKALFGSRTGRAASIQPQEFSPITTESDVLNCFRLILGRNPSPEELRGHLSRVGSDLHSTVASYVNSHEFSRRQLSTLGEDQVPESVRIADVEIYARQGDEAVGKHVLGGDYESHVTAIFEEYLRPGMNVLDIGANIGYFTMLAGRLVGPSGHVDAFEPNESNMKLLELSRRANGFENVTTHQIAVSDMNGILALNTSFSTGTTAKLSDELPSFLLSRIVPCYCIDQLLPLDRKVDFVKIDIDGAEYRALKGASKLITRWKPIIVSEFSPTILPPLSGIDGPGYFNWIKGLGYAVSVIQQDGELLNVETADDVMAAYRETGVDHIDILCLPV